MSTSIIPNIARRKMVEARAGIRTLPPITGFVFGDGGVSKEDGTTLIPDVTMTKLNNEILRKPYDSRTVVSDVLIRYHADIAEGEMNGKKLAKSGCTTARETL